jgi:hypothetical protein
MQLFVSYARPDKPKAGVLAGRLNQLGHDVWLDQRLTGGQDWWERILTQVRAADALVVLLSPAALRSQACSLERQCAARLGKPILPVLVSHIPVEMVPADLARVQIIDYTVGGEEAAIMLAAAVTQLPPTRPLPDPLPAPPPVPLSYLSHLGQRLAADNLTLDDQLDIVARLETGMRAVDEEERVAAGSLMGAMRERRDLFAETARRIDRLMYADSGGGSAASPPPATGPTAGAAAGTSAPVPPGTPTPASPGGPVATSAKSSISKPVKVLAWIGAIFLVLLVIGLVQMASDSSQTCYDTYGQPYSC